MKPEITANPLVDHRLKNLWEEYGDQTKFNYENTSSSLSEVREMWQATADAVPSLSPGDEVVDLGTGTGYMAKSALERYPGINVTAVDISLPFLYQAQANLSEISGAGERVKLLQADFTKPLPIEDDSLDLVTASWTTQYHDQAEQQAIFDQAARMLKKGKSFVMNSMINGVPFGEVVGGLIARALAQGEQEGVERLKMNIPISKEFGVAAQKGWAYHPTLEQLQEMHFKAGFTRFEVVRAFGPEDAPYFAVIRSTK